MNTETRRHFSRIGIAYFIGALLFAGVRTLTPLALTHLAPTLAADQALSFLISMLTTYIIAVPLMMLVIKRVPKKGSIQPCTMTGKQWIVTFLICYAGMYLANIAGNIITNIVGNLKGSTVTNEIVETALANAAWVNILVMVLLAPVLEELLFRKMLIDRTIKYGEGISVLISALFFGLFHGNLNQFAYAFVIGGVFAFVYVKTGNVKYTIYMHMLVNFLGSAVSMGLLKLSGMDQLALAATDPEKMADVSYLTNIFMSHLSGMLLLCLYALVLIILVIVGIVLFFKNIKKIHLLTSPNSVAPGARFRTYFLNGGMILFIVWWLVQIILQLLM